MILGWFAARAWDRDRISHWRDLVEHTPKPYSSSLTIDTKANQPNNDVPSLTISSRGWGFTYRIGSREPPYLIIFYLEILNKGAPTSLHDWRGFYTLNDGSSTTICEKDFDLQGHLLARNLVSDDKTIDRKCVGFVRFSVSQETVAAVKRVAIQFRDDTDAEHSVESDVRLSSDSSVSQTTPLTRKEYEDRRTVSAVQRERFIETVKRLSLADTSVQLWTTAPNSETEDYWKELAKLFGDSGITPHLINQENKYDPSGLVLVVQDPRIELFGHARTINDLLQTAQIPFVLGTDGIERRPAGWGYLHVGRKP